MRSSIESSSVYPAVHNEKNIIGSGLLAKAFFNQPFLAENICIYAAGVSNSGCTDKAEFERERLRLIEALRLNSNKDCFVYFSSCSIGDEAVFQSQYVQHKIAMEKLVSSHPNFIIARLPQVAGMTPNPNTLLNYLYTKISNGEKFSIWKNAVRNIIDVDHIALIVMEMVAKPEFRNQIYNVANPISFPISQVVESMEKVLGRTAQAEVIDKSSSYSIDIQPIQEIISKLRIPFDNNYLLNVVNKYYGQRLIQ